MFSTYVIHWTYAKHTCFPITSGAYVKVMRRLMFFRRRTTGTNKTVRPRTVSHSPRQRQRAASSLIYACSHLFSLVDLCESMHVIRSPMKNICVNMHVIRSPMKNICLNMPCFAQIHVLCKSITRIEYITQ